MNSPPIVYTSSFETSIGPFTVAVNEAGAIVATAFGTERDLQDWSHFPKAVPDEAKTAIAREQVRTYFKSPQSTFTVTLAPEGSEFQKRVWAALLEIPPGETRSYGEIARRLGSSARAVGRANATNPICLIIPCHRCIGADGSLTGYAYGEALKRRLLEHEGALEASLELS